MGKKKPDKRYIKAAKKAAKKIAKKTSKKGFGALDALEFIGETGIYAGTGAILGAANYFYDFSMKPVKDE